MLLSLHEDLVRPEWVDRNGHMNFKNYVTAFDQATDAFFDLVGIGEAYRSKDVGSTFTVESHMTYGREVLGGSRLKFTTQLLGFDAKRMHYFHVMHQEDDGYLAATHELMTLHIDLSNRRVAPMPEPIQARLAEIYTLHRDLPLPPQVGRVMGLNAGRPQ